MQTDPHRACLSLTMTISSVHSSSRFPSKAHTHIQTDRQTDKVTDATDHPTQAFATSVARNCFVYFKIQTTCVKANFHVTCFSVASS